MFKIVIISKDENSESLKHNLRLYEGHDIFLISPNAYNTKFNDSNLTKINDEDLLCFEKLKKKIEIERFGWYFQQFLKYESVLQIDGQEFLIIDGDSVVDSSLAEAKTLCSINKPINNAYCNLYKEFFPNDKIIYECFITNQMAFNKSILKELLNNIEKQSETDWIMAISKKINEKDKKNLSWFSEYQMYANYVLNRYQDISIKPVKVFRRFELINDSVENGLKKYNILAYEAFHKKDFLRKLRAKLFYVFGVNLG